MTLGELIDSMVANMHGGPGGRRLDVRFTVLCEGPCGVCILSTAPGDEARAVRTFNALLNPPEAT